MSQENTKDMSQYFYRASAADFMKIPGSPVAYWVSDKVRKAFYNLTSLSEIADIKVGLQTGGNDIFVREWFEVCSSKTSFADNGNHDPSKKWFPYNKGGEYRKWYGNNENIVNWDNDGQEIKSYTDDNGKPRSRPQNSDFYFRKSVTWSFISSTYFGARYSDTFAAFDVAGSSAFTKDICPIALTAFLCSKLSTYFLSVTNPTLNFQAGNIANLPVHGLIKDPSVYGISSEMVGISAKDWNSYETSWDFTQLPLLDARFHQPQLASNYQALRSHWQETTTEMQRLEEENNRLFIDAYGLQDELTPDVPLDEITLTCNPHYRYGGKLTDDEREARLQSDTLAELVSYAIGCMMGRYSLDKSGLILASQGETLQDYLSQIPLPRFMPDDDAILPLTDQEWFADDATNRFREFVRVVWGDEHLQENLDFVAESLCLHAIKAKRGESTLDTIRRYLSTQFYKDHMRTYKKRPIYWLFSSGKHKAFECLVYLHRYNEGTLARMRTEYVIPLTAKLTAYADKLEQDKAASASAAETKRLEKEITTLHKQQAELAEFDEKLRHYADQRIALDLDDGVKVNYGKFGDLLAEVKAVTGNK